ncbi:hypothetical protein JW698_00910 [Candidatus Wolfebacteria bacterium]|nr:hypothetical protein [Candidatus Wolfebacteria bacterium]
MEQDSNIINQSNVSELPKSEVSVRTMKLDIKNLEQGGGEIGAPEYLTSEQVGVKKEEKENKFKISGYMGPEKAIFSSSGLSLKKEDILPKKDEVSEEKKSLKWKILGIIIIALAVIVGFGFLGYFVISKLFFPNEMPSV